MAKSPPTAMNPAQPYSKEWATEMQQHDRPFNIGRPGTQKDLSSKILAKVVGFMIRQMEFNDLL